MKAYVYAMSLALLGAGCASQRVDVAGDWYFVSGGRLTLRQNGERFEGPGEWGDNPPRAIVVTGRVEKSAMTMYVRQSSEDAGVLRYDVALSPKGGKRFLKCRESIGLSLIPAGINYWEYDILKDEMTEQWKKAIRSQQGAGTER